VAVAHRQGLRRLDKTARTLGVFFNIHRHFPQPAAPPGARSAKVGTGFASDRAPNLKLARDLVAKPPHTFADHARSTETASSLGFR
jgi:hypothetical protein